ncbi:type II secretion system protein GspD [Coraliomargarita akajimensis]|uniref:Type II and III secretion system protein n=1 Tax=Coraliomargarita akajimensis (strain DSM 45221 / IAM 15411 / JCM 23193 / KCTC 12865 / 04OKA010-24) TaxID=583355 RepID=D5EMQ7_CORAD|nr:secretin N-terminal domain-containing protein [Coraliomargarita akajimensis]ADE55297.1 type II and III secretion system protein [Coraliomargarita akajimensis DSM 45221]
MKQKTISYLLFCVPIALFGQDAEPATEANSDVVVEAAPAAEAVEVEAPVVEAEVAEAEVVEIEEPAVAGVSVESADAEIPEVTVALPEDSTVVLDLPGQTGSVEAGTVEEEETISVDFPDEDVRVILFNVAELFDLNLVVPEALVGRTSIKLHNVTWREVFEVVLEPLGYAYIEDRNIIKVKSVADIAAEPVTTTVIAIKHARAADIMGSIAPLVDGAAGGKMVADSRKNLLVITERPSQIQKIRDLVDEVDRATEQVMIETKLVEVFDEDLENLGVNWSSLNGYGLSAGPFTRQWDRSREKSTGTTTEFSPATDNQPAQFVTGNLVDSLASTSRLDTAVFNADQFNVILSALETLNDTKLVTNPTVVVMNKRPAKFEVGRDYPIREITFNQETGTYEAGGVEETFIGVELEVTPEVLGGNIHLDVDPTISALDGTVESFGAIDPIVARRSVDTEVIIKDGYTLALGGLADTQEVNSGTKVPILGDIPGLGRLFSSDSDSLGKRNLIIFITAKTLNPEGSDYRDVIDPRMIEEMGITDYEVPGYHFREGNDRMSEAERDLLVEIEDNRDQAKRAEQIAKLQAQIDALQAADAQEE